MQNKIFDWVSYITQKNKMPEDHLTAPLEEWKISKIKWQLPGDV